MTSNSGFQHMARVLAAAAPLQPIVRSPHNLHVMRVGTVSHKVLTELSAVGMRTLSHRQLLDRMSEVKTRSLAWSVVKLCENGFVRKWEKISSSAAVRYSVTPTGRLRLEQMNTEGK